MEDFTICQKSERWRKSWYGSAFEYKSAAPRATLIIPSVEIKGGSLPNVINSPFINPQTSPTTNPLMIAIALADLYVNAGKHDSRKGQNWSNRKINSSGDNHKSHARGNYALIAVCCAMLSRLRRLKNNGRRIHRTITSTINPSKVPNCCIMDKKFCLPHLRLPKHNFRLFPALPLLLKILGNPALMHDQNAITHS